MLLRRERSLKSYSMVLIPASNSRPLVSDFLHIPVTPQHWLISMHAFLAFYPLACKHQACMHSPSSIEAKLDTST